jgi:multiple sugar transport system permease protein
MEFIGLDNYKLIFNFDSFTAQSFWPAVKNTLLFVAIQSPLLIILPFLIALLLHRANRFKGFFRGVIYFPSILSVATVGLIWYFMLDTNIGILNTLLGKTIPWITQMPYAWVSIFLMSTWWGIGGNMLLYLSGLSGVSKDLIEASWIDGANKFQSFLHVVIPQMSRTIAYVSIMTILSTFNIFGQPMMLTAGGPNYQTRVAIMFIYDTAFGGYKFGRATAMAIVMGIIMVGASITAYKLQKGGDNE